MIKMLEIVKSSVPAFSMTMEQITHVKKYLSYMKLNAEWLKEFDKIIFCINGEKLMAEGFVSEFAKEYPNIVPTLIYRENLGHTFGTLDVDFATWEYAEQNPDIEYIWKFAGDTLANPSILEIEIDETCDFFYLNNFGCTDLKNYTKDELVKAILDQDYLYPQTNYYFYKPQSIKRWYPDSNEILKLKEEYQKILTDNPEIKPWEALQGRSAGFENQEFVKTNRPLDIEGCACEAYLGYTALANNLKMQQLAPEESIKYIADLMEEHNLTDGSHKNFVFEKVGGLCHYHVMNGQAVPV